MKRTCYRIRLIILAAAATTLFFSYCAQAAIDVLTPETTYIANLQTAAEKGDSHAQHELGNHFFTGYGMRRDYNEAVKWYRRAADQGHAHAQALLGVMYANGMGITKSSEEAIKWWTLAAEQNEGMAQDQLGFAHLLGDGVRVNRLEAYKWFNLAASNGDKHAVKDRDSVAKFMNADEIADAQLLVDEWLTKHPQKLASNTSLSKKM